MDHPWRILGVISYGVAIGVVGEAWNPEAEAFEGPN